MIRRAIVALLLLTAACGPLPRPFDHAVEGRAYPLATLAIDVRVAAVAGLPAPAGAALAQAMAEALGGYGVTASSRPGIASRFVLEGSYADPAPDAPPPHEALIVWTLLDDEGEATGIHTQAVDAALAAGADAATLRAAGTEPAKALAGLIVVDAELTGMAGDTPAPAGLFLAGITGAPGDGNTALAVALRLVLASSGLGSTDQADAAAYVLKGTVAVEPPRDGGQAVEIRWRVATRDGTEVGEAVQRNTVPAGRLDRPWGAIAGLAARAAVDGIADIISRAAVHRLGEENVESRPAITLPPSVDLPPPPVPAARRPVPAGR